MPNFDVERYMGTWFNIRKNFMNVLQLGMTCSASNYELNEDGTVRVYNTGNWYTGWTDTMGKAVESEVTGPGSFVVDFWREPDASEESNYNVVDTDYRNYAIVYNCNESTWFGWSYTVESFGILGREPQLSDDLLTSLKAKTQYLIPYFNYDYYVVPVPQGDQCEYQTEPIETTYEWLDTDQN